MSCPNRKPTASSLVPVAVLAGLLLPAPIPAQLKARAPQLPLLFVENRGQANAGVRYLAKAGNMTGYFRAGSTELRAGEAAVRVRYRNANPAATLEGTDAQATRVNLLLGNSEKEWQRDVPTYSGVRYKALYPGIDLIYGAAARRLKSEYVVAPGADPSQIAIVYEGAGRPRVDAKGYLILPARSGELREERPEVYQTVSGQRRPVEAGYRVAGDGSVGFAIGAYDRSLPLIIDPSITFSTLLGGNGSDTATAVAVDASGAMYVAGWTDSSNLPTLNPVTRRGGGVDAFVAKYSPGGTSLVYLTYLGGSGDDRATGIAADSNGYAYICGQTSSANFPLAAPLQAKLKGGRDAFVARIGPAGNTLPFSTYYGGSGTDYATGIALDYYKSIYVTGATNSTDFPTKTPYQATNHGGYDAFLFKLVSSGTTVTYSTYLGGSHDDIANAIAVDYMSNPYITGGTWSSDFPLASPVQALPGGQQDAFVTRFDPLGSGLRWSTYLGGNSGGYGYPEQGTGIAVDSNKIAYVTGTTSSPNFPTAAAYQNSLSGALDIFVAKVSYNTLYYSTYFGGSSNDYATGIAVDGAGNVYVSGYTISWDFPAVNAIQGSPQGDYDAVLFELGPSGSLQYSTYLGGTGSDAANAVAVDPAGQVYIAGRTQSGNFPLADPLQSTGAGPSSAFLTQVVSAGSCTYLVAPGSGSFGPNAITFWFTVATQAGCAWTASSDSLWVHVLTPSGIGPGNAVFSADTNTAPTPRAATLTIAGLARPVTQAGVQ